MNLAAQLDETSTAQVQQCRRLAGVLTLTQTMLNLADQGDWEQVVELERERRDDLAECFSNTVSIDDSALIAEALAALLSLNEELMSKLNQAKTAALQNGVQFSRNRNALDNYNAVQINR
tara:strand:+ start:32286 stop:32645 length:360 start_codon:yes stop_codon:yes gene_type:complete